MSHGNGSVLLRFCATFPSWLVPSTHRTQRALQWWHQQQVNRLHDGAELIRDGILQELFAIRRGLELTHVQDTTLSSEQINQLEGLHHQLEAISNTLSPAFVRDSLPLAFQHLIQQWSQRYPGHTVSAQLPQSTHPMTPGGRIALTVLEELLTLFAVHLAEGEAINIDIHDENHDRTSHDHSGQGHRATTLLVGIDVASSEQGQAIAHLREIAYVRRAFEVLAQGQTTQTIHDSKVEWSFTW